MKRNIKRTLCVILAAALLGGVLGMTALADDTADVIYDASANQFTIKDVKIAKDETTGNQVAPYPDLFPNLKNMMPGDSVTQEIKVKVTNASGKTVKLYLKAESVNDAYKKLFAEGNATLTVQDPTGADVSDKLAAVTENNTVALGTFSSNETKKLTVQFSLPKEAGNDIAALVAELGWVFTAEVTSNGGGGGGGGSSRPSLNTKDHYGYIIGYPVDYYTGEPTTDQTKKPVRPEGKITRAEVATIYFRMLTDESRTKFWSQSNTYSDVKAGDWFNNAVSTLSNAGIIAGYEDGSFRPNGYITRAEFATIAARFFDATYSGKDLFPDIDGHWAEDYINTAASKGFVNGYEDGTFRPDRNITRAEAVTLVNRTLDRHPDKNYFTKDMLVWPDNMDTTKWYYADMQEATNSHQYQMLTKADGSQYEKWTKTLPIRNWEALEKAWSNANSSQGTGNVV